MSTEIHHFWQKGVHKNSLSTKVLQSLTKLVRLKLYMLLKLKKTQPRCFWRFSLLWRHVDLCGFCTFFNLPQLAKGQLISKQNCRTSPKKHTKRSQDLPKNEQNTLRILSIYPECILFVFWEKLRLHNFVLRLTDL